MAMTLQFSLIISEKVSQDHNNGFRPARWNAGRKKIIRSSLGVKYSRINFLIHLSSQKRRLLKIIADFESI